MLTLFSKHINYLSKNCYMLKLLILDRFASPLAVRPKEASDGFHTIGDVMHLTASAHGVACATTLICQCVYCNPQAIFPHHVLQPATNVTSL